MTSPYRWVVLACGAAATAASAAVQGGLPALGPALQETFGLSLAEVGAVFTAFTFGTVLTLFAWGVLADRIGERVVLAAGLALGAGALLVAASLSGYPAFLVAVGVTGMLASSTVGASGRAVMGWFPRSERGFALGLRQTAVPVGAATAAVALPAVAGAFDLDGALVGLAGFMALAGVACAVWVREPPEFRSAAPPAPAPVRDPRIWRLAVASAFLIGGQVGITSFLTLFLHNDRGWAAEDAALVLAGVWVGGGIARIAAGRWSDRLDARIAPLRRLALGAGTMLLASALLTGAPDAVLVPVLVVAGSLAASWNGLSFTAAAEISGRERAGSAIGVQNTTMRVYGSLLPVGLGAFIAATSWPAAFALIALSPLVGWLLLRPLVGEEDERRRARAARMATAA